MVIIKCKSLYAGPLGMSPIHFQAALFTKQPKVALIFRSTPPSRPNKVGLK